MQKLRELASVLQTLARPIALAAYTGHSEAAQRQQGSRGPPKIIPAQKEAERALYTTAAHYTPPLSTQIFMRIDF